MHKSDEIRIIAKQLLRAASSVGANYRAACRSRSDAEFYAKLSIVVEEADESLFWLEILEESILMQTDRLIRLKSEATEILSVVAKARSTMKRKQKHRSGHN
jgi:four helix bundle protein